MLPGDDAQVAHFLEVRRQLALAESGLGHHERAAALLDGLLERHGHEDNLLLVGLLHQARAEVAERAHDHDTCATHRAEMAQRFGKTQNPLLIAQCARANRSATMLTAVRHDPNRPPGFANTVATLVGGTVATLADPAFEEPGAEHDPVPFQTALSSVMSRTRAKSAYLYLRGSDGHLELAWSSTNQEALPACVTELRRLLDAAAGARRGQRGGAHGETWTGALANTAGFRLVALRGSAGGSLPGGVILEAAPALDLAGCKDLLEALGRAVEKQGLDSLSFITA